MPPIINFQLANRQTRSANPKRLIRTSDGDTPVIEQPVRMVSIDTPEKSGYAGGPSISQPKLDRCRERLQGDFFNVLPKSTRGYLSAKITPDAAQRHITAANNATIAFEEALEARLRIDEDSVRRMAVIPTGEIVDRYGRMLAYIAPWFEGGPSDPLPPRGDPARRTFNLQMIESGWAAFFPIYPSLPNNVDFNMAIAAAERAWNGKLGQWQHGEDLLLAYEFRACIKLSEPIATARIEGEDTRRFYTQAELDAAMPTLIGFEITRQSAADMISNAFQRHCVDLRTLKVIGLFDFGEVPPPYRLWIWDDQLEEAKTDLGLT